MFIKYPSPDAAVKSPVLRVDCQSIAEVTNVVTSTKPKLPEPSVLSALLALPSASGSIKVWLEETVPGAFKPI